MPLLRDDDVVRIDLPAPGEWVEVKRRLSVGDELAVKQAVARGMRVRPGSADIELDAAAAMEGATFATVERALKAWSFPEPVTPENIRMLDQESFDAIVAGIEDLNPTRSDEEKKASNSTSSPPSTSAGTGPRSSPTSPSSTGSVDG